MELVKWRWVAVVEEIAERRWYVGRGWTNSRLSSGSLVIQ